MPLYVKKRRYVKNDIVLASYISDSDDAHIILMLGYFDRVIYRSRLTRQRTSFPCVVPHWEMWHFPYKGRPFFFNAYDTGEIEVGKNPFCVETAFIHGAFVGKINTGDSYECRNLLNLCAKKLLPRYNDFLYLKALRRV